MLLALAVFSAVQINDTYGGVILITHQSETETTMELSWHWDGQSGLSLSPDDSLDFWDADLRIDEFGSASIVGFHHLGSPHDPESFGTYLATDPFAVPAPGNTYEYAGSVNHILTGAQPGFHDDFYTLRFVRNADGSADVHITGFHPDPDLVTEVPEPSGMALFGVAAVLGGLVKRRAGKRTA